MKTATIAHSRPAIVLACALCLQSCDEKEGNEDDDTGTQSEASSDPTSESEPTPCEARGTQAACHDPALGPPPPVGDAMATCIWETRTLSIVPGEACETATAEARCLTYVDQGSEGCSSAPCGPGVETVLYADFDGVRVVLPGDYCGIMPLGFAECEFASSDMLEDGPAECLCGCNGE